MKLERKLSLYDKVFIVQACDLNSCLQHPYKSQDLAVCVSNPSVSGGGCTQADAKAHCPISLSRKIISQKCKVEKEAEVLKVHL